MQAATLCSELFTQVLEFLESKRVPMDLNPGLVQQLYDLDWRLQSQRLLKVPFPSETCGTALKISFRRKPSLKRPESAR